VKQRSFLARLSVMSAWQTNAMLLAIGAGLLIFTQDLIREFDTYRIGTSGCAGWSVILYALAVVIILTQPVNRYTFPIILAMAIACRCIPILVEPDMSSDIYRYVWDGIVQHAHINPYRYVPGNVALTFLRAPHQDIFDNINRRDYAHTIYPPVAQMIFYATTWISPTVEFMKIVMVLFEGLTMYAMARILALIGVRREQLLLYAWCPLVIWEFSSSGHLDAAAMAFVALALLMRLEKRMLLCGIFLAAAVLTKMYPLVLFPALYRRDDWKMPAVLAGLIAASYACYASVGMRVFGFLGGYAKEEGLNTGTRYFALELVHHVPGLGGVPMIAFLVFAAAVLGALCWGCWQSCCNAARDGEPTPTTRLLSLPASANFLPHAIALGFAMMLLFSPHYPWYVAWMVPFFALVPDLPLFAYFCGLFYMCATALGAGTQESEFAMNEILYSLVVVGFVVEYALRRWKRSRRSPMDPRPDVAAHA
jgi:alpha-1,6-mannosyltransferase